ncbi:MAG: EfeM/EfeO family lipoprotein [Nocardioides sp.]
MSARRANRIAAAAATAVALLGLTACGSSSSIGSATGDPTATNSQGGVAEVGITLASSGGSDTCALSTSSVPAGPVTFKVDNQSATGITEVELLQDERILGEKENLAPGLQPVSFTVTLGGGSYKVYCPGASQEMTELTVTGQAAQQGGTTQALLRQGAREYATYADTQVSAMVQAVVALQKAVDSGDLAESQKAYAAARPYYERIESDVDGFVLPGFKPTDNKGNLDYLIDMRASNLDPAVGWSGFHAVERDVFARKQITASTKKLAANLTRNVKKLDKVVKTLSYKPEDLANGAASLLEEVQSNKITGEEENYSHIDLVDFAGNLEGAKEAFAYLEPGLKKIDAGMTRLIAHRFDQTDALLDTYRDPKALGGYESWTPALRAKAANKLSQSVQALQDSLSKLAEKVVTA